MKKKLIIVEIIVVIIMLISVIYSIRRVKVIISPNKKYMLKNGDNISTNIGKLEIKKVVIDEVKASINGDIKTYKYNKVYTETQRISPSTGINVNTITSIALKEDITFKRCNIYIPVTIAGILIILTCSIIKKTKKPKGEN